MAKNPKGGAPQKGSATTLQPVIKSNGSMIDPRMAPCGKNQLATPDNDGDESY